jgi:hypothetical protein
MMPVASARCLEHHLRTCNPEKTVVIMHHAPSGNTRAEAQRAQRGRKKTVFLCALCGSARKGRFPLLGWPSKGEYIWTAYTILPKPDDFGQAKFFVVRP